MHSLRPADFLVIAFYLGFLIAIGLVFRRFNRDISDYFRGGGRMLWWMSGSSAMMSAISAWSFTGAAGSVYETGTLVAAIYWSNALNLIFVYFFNSGRFRRLRVVTYAEAVRRRYGGVTEQFYVWVQLPVSVVKAGIELSALGVFMSAVFGTQILPTVVVLGAVVIVVAMLGGAWAVVAGDFLQSLLMLLVMGLACWFVLRLPEVDGINGLLGQLDAEHWDWGRRLRGEIVGVWCVATFINSFFNFNNMAEGAARFLTVKDEAEARKAALAMIGCFLALPFLLLTPALAATIVYPDLHAQFPVLRNSHEAAFVAVCLRTMPAGVIGLLVAGIFSVAMASMDTGLNRNSGLLIRNFYQRFVRPAAGERELLLASKACTAGLGLAILGVAGGVIRYSSLDLFNLILTFGSLVGLPLMIPTVFGLFVRRAPTWAGWTTPLIGLATGWTFRTALGAPWIAARLGWSDLSNLEATSLGYAATVLAVVIACSAWYAASVWIARRQPEPAHIAEFFRDLERPIDSARENVAEGDRGQHRTMSALCFAYGGGLALFAFLPTSDSGRASFIVCGGVIALVGLALRLAGKRARQEAVA
jgi:SSS family solute:Na+ symporter